MGSWVPATLASLYGEKAVVRYLSKARWRCVGSGVKDLRCFRPVHHLDGILRVGLGMVF